MEKKGLKYATGSIAKISIPSNIKNPRETVLVNFSLEKFIYHIKVVKADVKTKRSWKGV